MPLMEDLSDSYEYISCLRQAICDNYLVAAETWPGLRCMHVCKFVPCIYNVGKSAEHRDYASLWGKQFSAPA